MLTGRSDGAENRWWNQIRQGKECDGFKYRTGSEMQNRGLSMRRLVVAQQQQQQQPFSLYVTEGP